MHEIINPPHNVYTSDHYNHVEGVYIIALLLLPIFTYYIKYYDACGTARGGIHIYYAYTHIYIYNKHYIIVLGSSVMNSILCSCYLYI